jgi:hypothetical protein
MSALRHCRLAAAENSPLLLDKVKHCAILARVSWGGRVKYPVASSLRHKGKTIELDATREIITLIGINGEAMGNLSWDFVIDQILAYRKPPVSPRGQNRTARHAGIPSEI